MAKLTLFLLVLTAVTLANFATDTPKGVGGMNQSIPVTVGKSCKVKGAVIEAVTLIYNIWFINIR